MTTPDGLVCKNGKIFITEEKKLNLRASSKDVEKEMAVTYLDISPEERTSLPSLEEWSDTFYRGLIFSIKEGAYCDGPRPKLNKEKIKKLNWEFFGRQKHPSGAYRKLYLDYLERKKTL